MSSSTLSESDKSKINGFIAIEIVSILIIVIGAIVHHKRRKLKPLNSRNYFFSLWLLVSAIVTSIVTMVLLAVLSYAGQQQQFVQVRVRRQFVKF